MTNKLTRKKPNRLLTGRRNYFWNGSQMLRSPIPPIDSSLGGAQNPNANPTPSYNTQPKTNNQPGVFN